MASTECKILSLTLSYNNQSFKGEINESKRIIVVRVPYGTPLYTTGDDGAETGTLSVYTTLSKGASCNPANGAIVSYKTSVTYTVTAADGQSTQKYTVSVKMLPDATVVGVHNFNTAGWFNARHVIGNLGNYSAGGVTININGFVPKAVVGLQVDKGHVGFFDLNSRLLRVYSAQGTEASADETCEFSLVLLGQ